MRGIRVRTPTSISREKWYRIEYRIGDRENFVEDEEVKVPEELIVNKWKYKKLQLLFKYEGNFQNQAEREPNETTRQMNVIGKLIIHAA